jgi:membrane-associated phospholipid phosphatase
MKILILSLLSYGSVTAQVESSAGSWKTFVIGEVKNYRLPPPPGRELSASEITEVQVQQKNAGQKEKDAVRYWNAGAPGYRWNNVVADLTPPGIPAFREFALLNVAIYDATIAAWDSKYAYRRTRPVGLNKLIPVIDVPSYPCEYSVAAGAATTILSYLYPEKSDSFISMGQQLCASRIVSGVQYPSDVKQGFELGVAIAKKILERARLDGSDIRWTGSVPDGKGLWNGREPKGATHSKRKPWVVDSTNQFRPAAPPDFANDMDELRNFKKTEISNSRAFYYATRDEWTELTNKKIFEYNLHTNAPAAARVYALKSIAFHDALICCWEAKYYYWGIRPYQYDSSFVPVIQTPPFPGYPSGHATTSNAVATVLARLFPGEAESLYNKARECAESRFEGGIHFRTDNEVGLLMGRKIGEYIINKTLDAQ